MLYPKNAANSLDKELFRNPTSEYRGAPFWSWNCRLDRAILEEQIDFLAQMGFGGFHMHSRTGMVTEYLGEEFMNFVKICVNKAQQQGMLAWLYDEDRWPSGAAGGLVTKNPKYRVRNLLFTTKVPAHNPNKDDAIEKGEAYPLACYDICLTEKGELSSYRRMGVHDEAQGQKWHAFVVCDGPSPWFNNQTYVDTLSKQAIDEFIKITYNGYKNAVGDQFGSVVPAIFTDEPQFGLKCLLSFAGDKNDFTIPWTNHLEQAFASTHGIDITEFLPEIIWELPNSQVSQVRYLYHDFVAELFATSFSDNCGQWCGQNNLMLTGHLLAEPTLESQTSKVGDVMRHYRGFHLPGIDMLCDDIELTTAKQAQSACHQFGREGVLSELYGVTGWDFDFRGHKFQGDWQAALGVCVRVPHLSWVSMGGEAKRDYPASISYQSPWYKEYSYVEDHFARLNTALTRGKPVVNVGVIHPVESYWLHWGPRENTALAREQLDSKFQALTNALLFGLVDFDFICESLLPQLRQEGNPFALGQMEYSTIIVPACETLRRSTFEWLCRFKENGGRLIFLGSCPHLLDALPTQEIAPLYARCEKIPFDNAQIVAALDSEKLIDIRNSNGTVTNNLIYTMRRDRDCSWLFIAHAVKTKHADYVTPTNITLTIRGEYTPTLYNTLNGDISPINHHFENQHTIIKTALNCHDSLLLRLGEKKQPIQAELPSKRQFVHIDFKRPVPYKRSEPNLLLLDMAEYAFDDGPLMPAEEILRLDNKFRQLLNLPLRGSRFAQPWAAVAPPPEHTLTLAFTIHSEISLPKPVLAVENAHKLSIELNGNAVPVNVTGYYADRSINTLPLPPLHPGKNKLILKMPFGQDDYAEYCYLLGDFNLRLEGCQATIIEPTSKIGFGSITHQGMPFYGGNITYKTEFEAERSWESVEVKVANYRGSLIKVALDGQDVGVIAFAPYTLSLANISKGKHTLEFTLFGNRHNTFGPLHNADTSLTWIGPDAWRSTGDAWCYEYKLKDTGIMASPVVMQGLKAV